MEKPLISSQNNFPECDICIDYYSDPPTPSTMPHKKPSERESGILWYIGRK